jgi:predicted nuclease of predicted toxin-antitoxin system
VIVWLDNHLSPALARWIEVTFAVSSLQIRDLGLARAADAVIFDAARAAQAVLITKDRDFAELVDRRGAPPAIILLTCGNTSTEHLQGLLRDRLPQALALIDAGDVLVEIGGDA